MKLRFFIAITLSCLSFNTLVNAQYTRLFDFDRAVSGMNPYATLFSDGTYLYGSTGKGGANDEGTIFRILTDGTGYEKLVDFAGVSNGRVALGELISDGTYLYGTTSAGGSFSAGTIFRLMPDGTAFSKLYDFPSGTNGLWPDGALTTDSTYLYGCTSRGGINFHGTIYKVKMDGTGYQQLFDFQSATSGKYPCGKLLSDGAFLYGMTEFGGANNLGSIFKIKKDGTGFTKLLELDGPGNGSQAKGALISDGTFLYAMTHAGGINDNGTIFKIMPDGSGYIKLFEFDNLPTGRAPRGSLILANGFLYGMTEDGGTYDDGTAFKIAKNGTGYTRLIDFHVDTTGKMPQASLISDGTFLYGTTYQGGVNNDGIIFKYQESSTAVNDIYTNTGFSVCPNPMTEQATVQTSTSLQNGVITIFNCYGQQLRKITKLRGKTQIFSRQELPEGLYMINITDNGETIGAGKILVTDK